jgi:hypothetical protein
VIWVGLVAAIALALLFVSSVVSHVADPPRILEATSDMGYPRLAAVAATSTEALAATYLVAAPRLGGFLSALYLASLTAVVLWSTARGRGPRDCGCGRRPHEVDATWFARNAGAIAASLSIAIWAPSGYPLVAAMCAPVIAGTTAALFLRRARVTSTMAMGAGDQLHTSQQ